jgi:hypothetical protein
MKRYSISRFEQLAMFYFHTLHDCMGIQTCLHWSHRDVCSWDGLKVLHGFTLHHRDTTSGMAGNGFLQFYLQDTLIVSGVSRSIYYLLPLVSQADKNIMAIPSNSTGDKFKFCIMFVVIGAWTTSSRMEPIKIAHCWAFFLNAGKLSTVKFAVLRKYAVPIKRCYDKP